MVSEVKPVQLSKAYCPIYVPATSVEAYQTADNWKAYAARIQAML